MLSIYGCFYAGHDWAITQLQPLFHSLGHQVRVQTAVTASKGNQRGDVQIKGYLKHNGVELDLVYYLSETHGAALTRSSCACSFGMLIVRAG